MNNSVLIQYLWCKFQIQWEGGEWICADYNIINYKQGNEYIGLPGSYYTLFEEDQYGGFKRELTSINI